jgi:hypothetical protein
MNGFQAMRGVPNDVIYEKLHNIISANAKTVEDKYMTADHARLAFASTPAATKLSEKISALESHVERLTEMVLAIDRKVDCALGIREADEILNENKD